MVNLGKWKYLEMFFAFKFSETSMRSSLRHQYYKNIFLPWIIHVAKNCQVGLNCLIYFTKLNRLVSSIFETY